LSEGDAFLSQVLQLLICYNTRPYTPHETRSGVILNLSKGGTPNKPQRKKIMTNPKSKPESEEPSAPTNFIHKIIEDALKAKNLSDTVKVKDISELLNQ
jgi:hypothetical protein